MFARNEIRVFRADLTGEPGRRLPQLLSLLSDEERARHARFLRERDAGLFALGRAMLRLILGRCVGVAPRALSFESGPFGKPRLAPAHRSPLRFNASHSGDIVLVAFAVEREIGVDIETIRPLDDLDGLVRSAFSAQERSGIFAAADRLASFYAAWTRKEAVVKALGVGLSFPLDAFDIEVDPARAPALLHSRDASLSVADWVMHALPPTPGCASALAAERAADSAVVFEEWTGADLG
jgi:4'-phosphopantetheinyl transferase